MNEKSCQYTRQLVQKLNSGALEPGDEQHLAGCPECREALQIRKVLLEKIPETIPDRSALVWQQYTINKILQREKQQSGWQLKLSLVLEITGTAILAGLLFLAGLTKTARPVIPADNKFQQQLDQLLMHPVTWGAFLLMALVIYASLRIIKHKK